MIQDGIEFGVFARSVRVKLRLNCYAAAVPQTYSCKSYSAPPPFLVPVYASFFSTSTEVYETSHGRLKQRTFMTESVVNE